MAQHVSSAVPSMHAAVYQCVKKVTEWLQVHILPVGLGRETGQRVFTYYPRMPGNSTARPQEKVALQSGSMRPSFFQDAQQVTCEVLTLDDVMTEHGIQRIDLLKVRVLPCRSCLHAACT